MANKSPHRCYCYTCCIKKRTSKTPIEKQIRKDNILIERIRQSRHSFVRVGSTRMVVASPDDDADVGEQNEKDTGVPFSMIFLSSSDLALCRTISSRQVQLQPAGPSCSRRPLGFEALAMLPGLDPWRRLPRHQHGSDARSIPLDFSFPTSQETPGTCESAALFFFTWTFARPTSADSSIFFGSPRAEQ